MTAPLPLGELYQAYQCARDEAASALASWRSVPFKARPDAYAAYRAAVDREDAAADAWLAACRAFDRGLAA